MSSARACCSAAMRLSQTGGHGDMRGPGEQFRPCTLLRRARRGLPTASPRCAGPPRGDPQGRAPDQDHGRGRRRVADRPHRQHPVLARGDAGRGRGGGRGRDLRHRPCLYRPRRSTARSACGVRSIEHGNLLDEEVLGLLLREAAPSWCRPSSTYERWRSEGVAAGMPKAMCDKVFEIVDAGKATHAKAAAKGVKMVFGTDLLGSMHRHQLHEFSIAQAPIIRRCELIRSATVNAAELFGSPASSAWSSPARGPTCWSRRRPARRHRRAAGSRPAAQGDRQGRDDPQGRALRKRPGR